MIRIACRIASRTTGSPSRETSRPSRVGDLLARTVPADHAAREHQPERGGVDQEALGSRDAPEPVHVLDLVADQPVLGLRVGHAQERLGQAHQHHALARVEAVGVHERLDPAGTRRLGA
jgi:hypothetical protein